MIVILLKDVKGTGKAGDVVKVSDGYARNMLIPKGFAQQATEGNVRNLEKAKAVQEEKFQKEKQEAEKLAEQLEAVTVEIKTKGGEGGRLFGSITSKDIAEGLLEQHGVAIDKKRILLDSPIKQTGSFILDVKLFYEVIGHLKVNITV
ncbi:MAG: 50S ribosomal protein L9 [Anaerovoracaceae bacterium]|jgi:large subunit ribosomal protein L9